MPYITTEVEVEVDLEDFDDEDIIEEYSRRGFEFYGGMSDMKSRLFEIYQLRRQGKPYDDELNKFICDSLGVVI